eukprot:5035511-Alexandrium_andersonii.AAC.1
MTGTLKALPAIARKSRSFVFFGKHKTVFGEPLEHEHFVCSHHSHLRAHVDTPRLSSRTRKALAQIVLRSATTKLQA